MLKKNQELLPNDQKQNSPRLKSESSLLVKRDGGVLTLCFNRPQVLNALNKELSLALLEAVQEAEFDPAVRCLVLTGEGAGFMSGGDIQLFGETLNLSPQERKARFHTFIQHVHPTILSLKRMPKPVIASVNGVAAGYGLSLMMACDLSIASTKSSFSMAYSRMGLSPDGGATYFLPRLVGQQKAMSMALLGETLSAEEALACHLVTKIVSHDTLETETKQLADKLAEGPGYAYARTKELIQSSFDDTLPHHLYKEENSFADCTASYDFTEAAMAFLEKRLPKFNGR